MCDIFVATSLNAAVLDAMLTNYRTAVDVLMTKSQGVAFQGMRMDELADIAWALAASHHDTAKLPELEAALLSLGGFKAMRPLHCATCLWAFAQLNYVPGLLLETLDQRWKLAGKQTSRYGRRWAKPALSSLSPRQLGTCAWSLAVMGQTSSPAFRALWKEICGRGLEALGLGRSLRKDTLMQIHQAGMSLDLEAGGPQMEVAAAAQSEAGAALLLQAKLTWQSTAKPVHNQRESVYESQIANSLVGLGLFHVRVRLCPGAAPSRS